MTTNYLAPIIFQSDRTGREWAIVRLYGEVNESNIYNLCDQIDLCIEYYQYKEIEIQINSPGGAVSYLDHFFQKKKDWENNKVKINTLAMTQIASAGALILSLGCTEKGISVSYPNANILYHSVNVSRIQNVRSVDAERILKELNRIDDKYISELKKVMIKNFKNSTGGKSPENVERSGKGHVHIDELTGQIRADLESYCSLPLTDETKEQCADIDQKLTNNLKNLFAAEYYLSAQEARYLCLINQVKI